MNDPGMFIELLGNATPVTLFVVLIFALLKGWLILPDKIADQEKRLEDRDKRIVELVDEKDEFKEMAFRALNIGERVADVHDNKGRRS